MESETSIIRIFCYQLPFEVSSKIYNEFEGRLKDINYMIDNFDTYSSLKQHKKAVEIILATTIFYKRVITNLDCAVKFHGTVSKKSSTDIVSIGKYDLDTKEKNKILGITINFWKVVKKYQVPDYVFDYYETSEFLNKLKDFLTQSLIDNDRRGKK